jgi:HEAT repeat protein
MDGLGKSSDSDVHRRSENDDIEPASVHGYMASLCDKRALVRQHARKSLVQIGHVVVPELMQALIDRRSPECMRWEAAKALSEIGDPDAASALVLALEQDHSFGVRWLAADGLVNLGHKGLVQLLTALIEHPDSAWLREGAHHVLRTAAEHGLYEQIGEILDTLEEVEATLAVPLAATASLKKLANMPGRN